MKGLKRHVIFLCVTLIWCGFTSLARAESEGYEVMLTAYTCEVDARNSMHPCGTPRWGGDPYEQGLACPVAWRDRILKVPGYGTFRCDDTIAEEYLNGLPHLDLRVPTWFEARQIGIRRITVYDANRVSANSLSEENNSGSGSGTYTVVAGDTLSSIAQRYNTTIDDLRTRNELSSNMIRIGQRLQVPAQNGATSTSASTNTESTNQSASTNTESTNQSASTNTESTNASGIHIVAPGETLSGIAEQYNTTVEYIRMSNNLTSHVIGIGQELEVPVQNSGKIVHTVKKGESISSIASQYNVSSQAIQEANNLDTPNLIQPDQQLLIP